MAGFKKFLLQGNLVDIAVAFIVATAFGKVVEAFTAWLTSLMPKSVDNVFSDQTYFGAFMNTVVAFVIVAAVVYFLVVTPYTKAKEKFFPDAPAGPSDEVALLTQIRDSLATR